MVAESRTYVDVEGAVRAWARAAIPEVQGRVFFAFNGNVSGSQIVLSRIAGPDDRCLIQIDVLGVAKAAAAQLAAVLATEVDAIGRYTSKPGDGEAVILHGAVVEGVRWQPDPESGAARYVVDATFTATATQ